MRLCVCGGVCVGLLLLPLSLSSGNLCILRGKLIRLLVPMPVKISDGKNCYGAVSVLGLFFC